MHSSMTMTTDYVITNPKGKLIEIDIIKTFAISAILLAHLSQYVSEMPFLIWASYALTNLGTGLFTFASGFSLSYSASFEERFQPLRFVKKRVLRIYPLYVPALFLFILLFHYLELYHRLDFAPVWFNTLVHMVGGQALLYSKVSQSFTLWYIGLIVPLYLFFIAFALCRTRLQRLLIIVGTAAALFTIQGLFEIIDVRMFLHYPVFVAGILADRSGILSSRRIGGGASLAALLICIGSYVVYKKLELVPVWNDYCGDWLHLCAPSLAMITIMIVSGITFGLWFSSWWETRISDRTRGLILFLSTGSYAVYLYHRPILGSAAWYVESFTDWSANFRIAIFSLLLVVVLFIGYGIQSLEKRIRQMVSRQCHKTGKHDHTMR
jgi:peptidoglycan/LPS O-acetylase OafA/YrhL